MKIKRSITDSSTGRSMEVEEIVEIDVKPGWKDGTKVTFAGKGDEIRGRPAQDVQFVIKEQPHGLFKRDGNDLTYTARIQLKDALVGGRFTLQHLNGNNIPVAFAGPVAPTTVQAMRCVYSCSLARYVMLVTCFHTEQAQFIHRGVWCTGDWGCRFRRIKGSLAI